MAHDHLRVYKCGARLFGGFFVSVAVLVGVESLTTPGSWLASVMAGLLLGVIAGFVVAFGFWFRAFARDDREWRETGYTHRQRVPPARPRERRRRPAWRGAVGSAAEAVGVPALMFGLLPAVGLPLTIVGAVAHVHWLLTIGVMLLVTEGVDLAVVWPIRRARHPLS